jgi:hypothetical protein
MFSSREEVRDRESVKKRNDSTPDNVCRVAGTAMAKSAR